MTVQVLRGDALEQLRSLAGGSVRCCVTSPPYWGLRDYGVAGQLGLERTPDEYVAALVQVFREVRRVLADNGTLWLNLGDSYSSGASGGLGGSTLQGGQRNQAESNRNGGERCYGMAPKNLVGIPWMVARALRDPYYAGRITRERDRVWLAATIDAEGSICGFDHDRADGDGHRSGVHLAITNTSTLLLDEAARIWPTSRSEHQRPSDGHLGKKMSWRWLVHGVENKQAALRELYPHLIVKRQQAVVAYSLLLLMADAKRLGHSAQKDGTIAKRAVLTGLLSDLNHQRPCVLPEWLTEPPSLFEPGWYLRSAIIWAKPNGMPGSQQDRPTSSYETVFLLSRAAVYYSDFDAIKTPPRESTAVRLAQDVQAQAGSHRANGGTKTNGTMRAVAAGDKQRGHGRRHSGFNERWDAMEKAEQQAAPAMMRDVWFVSPASYDDAHFAVMPSEVARRCILAGSALGDTILDPFGGAGTTGLVADRLGRNAVLIELNPAYATMAEQRIHNDAPLFSFLPSALSVPVPPK